MVTIEKTITLIYRDGYFRAEEGMSETLLREALELGAFPETRDHLLSTLVHKGFRVAIKGDYKPLPYQEPHHTFNVIGGKQKTVNNPCSGCYLRNVCDVDECGRKKYRLFTNKKPK